MFMRRAYSVLAKVQFTSSQKPAASNGNGEEKESRQTGTGRRGSDTFFDKPFVPFFNPFRVGCELNQVGKKTPFLTNKQCKTRRPPKTTKTSQDARC